VNIASRMGGMGGACEVMVTRASFNRLGSGFAFDSVGLRRIKGISEEIECGRVTITEESMQQEVMRVVSDALQEQEQEQQHSVS
ncbi:MAG: hypothetical protein Q9M13_07130, partial [Mariprofundales bacterium]|nr:hypothetical protein [Mariprofundales bacterium]